MTKKRRIAPGWGLLLAAAMLAGVLAAATLLVRPWQERFLQSYWTDKLAGADRADLPEMVETIAAFGAVGLPTLIAGLESDRQPVVDECYRQLRLLMDHWSLLPRAKGAGKLAQCARLLSHGADRRGPAARGMAADLARRLLWMTDADFPPQRRLALVQHCETVMALEPAAFERPAAPDIRLAAFERDAGTLPPDAPPPATISQPATDANASSTPAPPTPVPAATNQNADRPSRSLPPAAGPATAQAESSDSAPVPNVIDVDPEARRLTAESPFSTRRTRVPGTPASEPRSVTTDGEHGHEPVPGSEMLTLMRQLHSRRPGVSDDAEAELRNRGLGATQITLARRLTDPRPSVRQALVDELPSSAGIDSRQWLLWLARDHNADVRLAALTVMATAGDPMLLRQVGLIAREDSDPRIVALAERVVNQVRAAR